MAPKVRTAARKAPRQERAQETVEAILKATAHVLIAEGYDHASTNKIALKAGVSIGSLYQYFPSKEALVAALIDRHLCEVYDVLVEQLPQVADAPMETAVRTIIASVLRVHRHNPKLHRVLIEQVPKVGKMKFAEELEERVTTLVLPYLEYRKRELAPKNLELAAFVLTRAVQATTHALAFDVRGRFDEAEMIDELSRLVLRYLVRD
jgi:AcrR family transcriptional regulator